MINKEDPKNRDLTKIGVKLKCKKSIMGLNLRKDNKLHLNGT